MNAITLRNLPPEVALAVRKRSMDKGISLNRAVIELLQEALGGKAIGGRPKVYHDLDFLIGSWSREEAEAFDRAISEQRKIDPELWQ